MLRRRLLLWYNTSKKVTALTADVTALTATIHQLERIIQVLALENQRLKSNGPGVGR